jgi:formiminoglutamase
LRRPAVYPTPRYKDPDDRRFVSLVGTSERAMPKSVNLLGVPYDGAVLGRRGAAEGPSAIRQAFAFASNYNPELGMDLLGEKVFDLGDVEVGTADVRGAHQRIGDEVLGALDASSLLVLMGGDNSVSLPSITACAKKFHKIGLVVLDSHYDLRGEINGKPTSGSSYGLAIKSLKEELDPRRVVEVGAHGFVNSRAYADVAKRLGIVTYSAADVRNRGAIAVAKEAYTTAAKGSDAVYLSIDLDCVDISQVSGVSAPSQGGLDAREVNEFAFHLAGKRNVPCADLVELAPRLDPTGRSQIVASNVVLHLAAGFMARRG